MRIQATSLGRAHLFEVWERLQLDISRDYTKSVQLNIIAASAQPVTFSTLVHTIRTDRQQALASTYIAEQVVELLERDYIQIL